MTNPQIKNKARSSIPKKQKEVLVEEVEEVEETTEAPVSVSASRPQVLDAEIKQKPTSISRNALSDILKTSSGLGTYDISFPSIGLKDVVFKQLTVGQQKTIAKASLDSENRLAQIKLRKQVIKEISNNAVDIDNINIAEYLITLLQMRNFNFSESPEFNITCSNKDCEKKYPYIVDIDSVVERAEKANKEIIANTYQYAFEQAGHKIIFHMSLPTVKVLSKFIEYAQKEQEKKNEIDLVYTYYMYITAITVDGIPVDGIEETLDKGYSEFANFFEETFVFSLTKFAEEVKKFSEIFDISIEEHCTCPFCQAETKFSLDINDFF